MDVLRRPFFVLALVLLAIAVLAEVGSLVVIGGAAPPQDLQSRLPAERRADLDDLDPAELSALQSNGSPPGFAIPYSALLDGTLLFAVALMGIGMVVGERIQARTQGIATLIFTILLIIGGIVMIIIALASLLVMVSLLLSVPFGTIAYFAIYGWFDRGGASVLLGLVMALKIGFVLSLIAAHQRFIQNKGLVILIVLSFVGSVIIGFLHGLVPIFLVSITDAIGGIVVGIIAVIWAVVLFISSLVSIVKALNLSRV